MGIYRPTAQMIAVKNEITAAIDEQLDHWSGILEAQIPQLNDMIREQAIDFIQPD
jgi:hypothetical protein